MKLTIRQKKILEEVKKRGLTIFQKASLGDKVARHWTEVLLGAGDYSPSDMDGPKNYENN